MAEEPSEAVRGRHPTSRLPASSTVEADPSYGVIL